MKLQAVTFILLLLTWCSLVYAGESEKSPATAPKPVHQFFDLKNSVAMSSFAATLAGDSLLTQEGLARPRYHEINPVARLFVQSRPGAILYATGSFGLVTGGMYMAHKTGHHKLERVVPFGLAALEGFIAIRNYRIISRSR